MHIYTQITLLTRNEIKMTMKQLIVQANRKRRAKRTESKNKD